MARLSFLLVLACATGASAAGPEPVAYPVRFATADAPADAFRRLPLILRAGAAVTPEPVTNTVFVTGAEPAVGRAILLLTALDRRPGR